MPTPIQEPMQQRHCLPHKEERCHLLYPSHIKTSSPGVAASVAKVAMAAPNKTEDVVIDQVNLFLQHYKTLLILDIKLDISLQNLQLDIGTNTCPCFPPTIPGGLYIILPAGSDHFGGVSLTTYAFKFEMDYPGMPFPLENDKLIINIFAQAPDGRKDHGLGASVPFQHGAGKRSLHEQRFLAPQEGNDSGNGTLDLPQERLPMWVMFQSESSAGTEAHSRVICLTPGWMTDDVLPLKSLLNIRIPR